MTDANDPGKNNRRLKMRHLASAMVHRDPRLNAQLPDLKYHQLPQAVQLDLDRWTLIGVPQQ